MKNQSDKSVIYIIITALILLAVNAAVFVEIQQAKLVAPTNIVLWGIFAVLNMVSLLWAVMVMGLQPLLLAVSYVAGAALAYFGVKEMGTVNVAEVTTAGAVYGGVGALTVGNVFVKMRTIFFEKGQIPFIAIVVVLLILDGVLNTQLSSANWPVFLHAMLLPFGVGGIVLGTVGVTLFGLINKNAQVQEAKKSEDSAPETKKASPSKPEPKKTAAPKVEAKKPVVSSKPKEVIPTKTSTEDVASQQRIAERRAAEKKAEEERIRAEQKAAAEQLLAERRAAEKKAQEQKSALKEDAPVEQKVVAKETVATAPIENLDTKSVKKEEPATSNESKQGDEKSTSEGDITSDWLSSQLNLLNKISKNEDKDK